MFKDRFDDFLRKYATPATVALSLIVGVTGVLLFFHVAKDSVEALHEWLGMAFVLVAGLHAYRHRRAVALLSTQARSRMVFGAAVICAGALVALAPAEDHHDFNRVFDRLQQAPLASVAPVLGKSAGGLVGNLRARGLAVAGEGDTLAGIAAANGVEVRRLIGWVSGEAP